MLFCRWEAAEQNLEGFIRIFPLLAGLLWPTAGAPYHLPVSCAGDRWALTTTKKAPYHPSVSCTGCRWALLHNWCPKPPTCTLYWVQMSSDPQLEPHTIYMCLVLGTGELWLTAGASHHLPVSCTGDRWALTHSWSLTPSTCVLQYWGQVSSDLQLEPHTIYLCLVLGTGELWPTAGASHHPPVSCTGNRWALTYSWSLTPSSCVLYWGQWALTTAGVSHHLPVSCIGYRWALTHSWSLTPSVKVAPHPLLEYGRTPMITGFTKTTFPFSLHWVLNFGTTVNNVTK